MAWLVLHVLIIPHSNVEPERVFSKKKLTVRPERNLLHTQTTSNLIVASHYLKNEHGDCRRFAPTQQQINSFLNFKYNRPINAYENNVDIVPDNDNVNEL